VFHFLYPQLALHRLAQQGSWSILLVGGTGIVFFCHTSLFPERCSKRRFLFVVTWRWNVSTYQSLFPRAMVIVVVGTLLGKFTARLLLNFFLPVSKTLLCLFQNHAALLNCIIHSPSIACVWWSIAMSWSLVSFLRTDATSSSQMIEVTPLRSQVTLAKRFTMPISPVLMTLLRGRACSWFATLACCLLEMLQTLGVRK
jgi:hypothetical protein